MSLLGIDVSHFQGTPNVAALKNGGIAFVIEKATQGVSYVDPTFAATRRAVQTSGLINGSYHFAQGQDPTSEANHYCDTVGTLAAGELAVLDYETSVPNPVQWCLTWLRVVESRLGIKPLIYLNASTVNGFDWSPVVANNNGLWLAKYDQVQAPYAVKWWNGEAIKQYYDKGTVSGVAGQVDCDVFFGDLATLVRYGKQVAVAPVAPSPAPAPVAPAAFDVRSWRAHVGATGAVFTHLQEWANRTFPSYAAISPAPVYGPATAAFLAEFCRRQGVTSDGNDIGPKTAQLLADAGFRG